ncbi:flippase activity-associated protein Agl23 [Bdellovibrio sp. HCB2-146]|uniref:flippase activity-associated protein Agl23 n=1 Tax=Bdellovibrio sp. HCB2-146 TaxID=3394362 RepID=UPI0039BC7A41
MNRKLSFSRYHGFLLFVLVLAVVSRFLFLTNKPVHFDEGINGWFVMQMTKTGFYKYDPTNYHGPLYFYLLLILELFLGRSVATLRALPSLFGVASVLFVGWDFFATRKVRVPLVLFLLLSPAFLFFGRSGIHEMPFVFFQLVGAVGLLRWIEKKDTTAFNLVIVGLWGAMLLKETFAVTMFAWGVAFLTLGWAEIRALFAKSTWSQVWNRQTRLLSLSLLAAFVLFFTGFMANPRGIVDFFAAFLPWMKTGHSGNGHEKEFLYWVKVLVEAEPLVILGMLCSVPGVFAKNKSLRAISVFSLVQFFIYSIIPYKTVWCILSLVWGFYFVLAYSLNEVKHKALKIALWTATIALGLFQLKSAYQSVYAQPIRMEHPYVYVNSTYEMKNLTELIEQGFARHPEWGKETIQVGMREQWPWPWVFHSHDNLDYNQCGQFVKPDALVYFCDLVDTAHLESQLQLPYIKIIVTFRQSKEASVVYLRAAEFESLYQGNSVRIEPKKGTP